MPAIKLKKGKMDAGSKNIMLSTRNDCVKTSIFMISFRVWEKSLKSECCFITAYLAVCAGSSGQNKNDVPITGSLDDPKFSVGAIVTMRMEV